MALTDFYNFKISEKVYSKKNKGYGPNYISKEDFENTKKVLMENIERESGNAEYYCEQGKSLTVMAYPEEALKAYNKAIKQNPNHAVAHHQRGKILEYLAFTTNDKSKNQEALKAHDRAIELDPDYLEAYFWKVETLKNLGYIEEAEIAFGKFTEIKDKLYKQKMLDRRMLN